MLPQTYQLKKVVNISVRDDKVYTTAVFERNWKIEVYELRTSYEDGVESMQEAISKENVGTGILDNYPLANYDSASSLLKSNSYAGQMEEYRQQGYTFKVISQVVGEYDSEFKIFATYKLSKGDEIKYINTEVQVGIFEPSSNEKTNYTTKVENPEARIVYEDFFCELTGDQIDFVTEIERLEIPLVMEIEEEKPSYGGSSGYIFRFPSAEMLFNV